MRSPKQLPYTYTITSPRLHNGLEMVTCIVTNLNHHALDAFDLFIDKDGSYCAFTFDTVLKRHLRLKIENELNKLEVM